MALHNTMKAAVCWTAGIFIAATLGVGTAAAQSTRQAPAQVAKPAPAQAAKQAAPAQPRGQTPAQAAEWKKILEGANKEGKVVLYTAQVVPVANRLVAGFKKAYPDIAIEFVRGATGDLLPKLDQEMASNADGGDVLISTDIPWLRDKAKAAKLTKPAGPAAVGWPAKYQAEDGAVVTVALEPLVILYNTAQVKPAPRSYADLINPKYKGKIGSSDLAATTLIAWYDWLEKTQGPTFLTRLRALDPKMYHGASPSAQAVASGEVLVNVFGNVTITKALQESGAPINFVVPNPGLGIQYAMGVMGWAKRPNAALVFADYVMSREGQEVLNGRGETASPLTGIKGSLQASSITPWDTDAYPADVVKKYTAHWDNIFK